MPKKGCKSRNKEYIEITIMIGSVIEKDKEEKEEEQEKDKQAQSKRSSYIKSS